jgi:hypothetical protein
LTIWLKPLGFPKKNFVLIAGTEQAIFRNF